MISTHFLLYVFLLIRSCEILINWANSNSSQISILLDIVDYKTLSSSLVGGLSLCFSAPFITKRPVCSNAPSHDHLQDASDRTSLLARRRLKRAMKGRPGSEGTVILTNCWREHCTWSSLTCRAAEPGKNWERGSEQRELQKFEHSWP